MIYKFTMVSDEVDDFVRVIQLDPDATFYDFHLAILKSVGYPDDEPTAFFICDDNWEREKEITLEVMDDNSEEETYTMKDTKIGDMIEDEKQKLTYVFDVMTERSFFIELSSIITKKELKAPVCTHSEGNPPKQRVDFDEAAKQMNLNTSEDMGENFYGDNEYDEEDLDQEGFGLDGEDNSYE
jgi:hypothetical protein